MSKTSKKHKKTKFQDQWLIDPILKLCTERVSENPTVAKCLYCKKTILVENYLEHLESTSHSQRTPEAHKVIISKISEEEEELNKTALKTYLNSEFHKRQLELLILHFVVENNLSFEVGGRFGTFLSSLKEHQLSQIKNISINSKKLSSMISHCIKPTLEEMALQDLMNFHYSLLLDIAKDCTGASHLSIMVRYYKNEDVQIKLLKNIEVKDSITGEAIYKILKEHVLTNDLVIRNLVGLSTDNGSIFSGAKIGLYGKLKEIFPNLYYQTCMCHNYDLIAEDSMEILPNEVIDLIKDISAEFSHLNAKKAEFEKIQEELKLPKKTPKKWVTTRWLSLDIFLEDFFEQLPAYIQYYGKEDKKMQSLLNKKLNQALIAFLKVMTDELCIYNKLYQNDNANPFSLYNYTRKHFLDLFCIIAKEEHTKLTFDEIKKMMFDLNQDFMNNDEILFSELKIKLRKLFDLTTLKTPEKKQFLRLKRNYINKCLRSMKSRCPLENPVFENFKALDLKNFSRTSWIGLFEAFPHLLDDESKALEELNLLRDLDLKELTREDQEPGIWEMWKNFKKKHGKTFPNIYKLGIVLLSLPVSTAAVEREFKQLKAIRTENRTSLKIETLNSVLVTKDAIEKEMFLDKKFVNTIYKRYGEFIQAEKERRNSKNAHSLEENLLQNSLEENQEEIIELTNLNQGNNSELDNIGEIQMSKEFVEKLEREQFEFDANDNSSLGCFFFPRSLIF